MGKQFSLRRFSMRGTTSRQATMLSTLTTDSLIPMDHPIRGIKPVVEAVLAKLAPEFDAMYARTGRQSVPPEHLLKATVLMALYSIRSQRQFCERLRYDLLFKFFLDLNVDDEGFDHSTFSRNRKAPAHPRDRRPLLRGGGVAGPPAPLHLGRALQRGRHPARGVGLAQELRRPPTAGPLRRGALSRREAQQ
ncbi:MAG: transposase [Candidatus Dormibacteria bacterium]